MIVLNGINESIDLYKKVTKIEEIKSIQYCLIDQDMLVKLCKYEITENHYIGLKLFSNSSLIDNLSDYINKLSLIEIEFEYFKDGRARRTSMPHQGHPKLVASIHMFYRACLA